MSTCLRLKKKDSIFFLKNPNLSTRLRFWTNEKWSLKSLIINWYLGIPSTCLRVCVLKKRTQFFFWKIQLRQRVYVFGQKKMKPEKFENQLISWYPVYVSTCLRLKKKDSIFFLKIQVRQRVYVFGPKKMEPEKFKNQLISWYSVYVSTCLRLKKKGLNFFFEKSSSVNVSTFLDKKNEAWKVWKSTDILVSRLYVYVFAS